MFNKINSYINKEIDLSTNTPLYEKNDYGVYWLGINNETAFRCNVYLIKNKNQAYIIDPGGIKFFNSVKKRLLKIIDKESLKGIITLHQDPDVCSSIPKWLKYKPELDIITSNRTNIILPHYGIENYNYINIDKNSFLFFEDGKKLSFITSPFLHFPGAFTIYDHTSKFLFSSDIWASLDIDWSLVTKDFNKHKSKMDLFCTQYFASNIATRGYVKKIDFLEIDAILPQHGSIINKDNVSNALEYLKNLRCGTDIIYNEQ